MVAETLRRNRKITITTSPSVSSMVNSTSLYDSRIVSDRSYRMSMLTEGGSSVAEDRQQVLDAVGDFDGVGAGLALNRENDRAAAALVRVEPRRRLVVFHAVDDVAQFFQAHRRAAAVRHHDRPICAALINCPLACSVKARCGPMIEPVGRLTFQFFSAVSISLMPICREASACGSICTCTAYFCAPSTCTCATPEIIEMRCAMRVSAYSSRVHSGSVGEVSAM